MMMINDFVYNGGVVYVFTNFVMMLPLWMLYKPSFSWLIDR